MRKMAKSGLEGEVYALSEMFDHISLLREFDEAYVNYSPGMVGIEDCESLCTHLRDKGRRREVFDPPFVGDSAVVEKQ